MRSVGIIRWFDGRLGVDVGRINPLLRIHVRSFAQSESNPFNQHVCMLTCSRWMTVVLNWCGIFVRMFTLLSVTLQPFLCACGFFMGDDP